MWRVIRWTLGVGLFCAMSVGVGQSSMNAWLADARTALGKASRHQQAGPRTSFIEQGKIKLAVQEAVLGENHPDVVQGLNNLAISYKEQGLYGRAEPLFQRVVAIEEATLGPQHPLVAHSLNELALSRLAQGRVSEAVSLFSLAFNLSEERLRKETLEFPESRMASYLQSLHVDEERLYALLRAYPNDVHVRRLALTAALLRKGRSTEETANASRAIYSSLTAQDRDTFEQLRDLRTQFATLSLEGPGSLSAADHQQHLKELTDQGDALEADLARRSAPLRARSALPPPGEIVDRVAAALPQGSALIEFVAYYDRPLIPAPGTPMSQGRGQLRYLALVLFSDGLIRSVDLGPADPIDSAATGLRSALADKDAAYQVYAQKLYALAFRQVLPLLGNTRRIYLAPDGQFGLAPIDVLQDGHRPFIDAFDLTYLTSGKDLLPPPEEIPSSGTVVVLADPALDTSPATHPSLPKHLPPLRGESADSPWSSLPGARQEAETIQSLFPQARLFLGADATKEQLMHLHAPSILHLATHGYFLEDASAPAGSRSLGHVSALSGDTSTPLPQEPMLRSGLVLSSTGARTPNASSAKRRPAGVMVTALELAGLDLWGTELVVLSACDTGRGDVELGQGIYGLRRALVIAGAETVVTSLWKVNDETTRMLMESYYRNLLAGEGRGEALRNAMRTLRKTHPHPHDWAPFISLGRDTPLRSLSPHPAQHP